VAEVIICSPLQKFELADQHGGKPQCRMPDYAARRVASVFISEFSVILFGIIPRHDVVVFNGDCACDRYGFLVDDQAELWRAACRARSVLLIRTGLYDLLRQRRCEWNPQRNHVRSALSIPLDLAFIDSDVTNVFFQVHAHIQMCEHGFTPQ
jgi:hypothetical protein